MPGQLSPGRIGWTIGTVLAALLFGVVFLKRCHDTEKRPQPPGLPSKTAVPVRPETPPAHERRVSPTVAGSDAASRASVNPRKSGTATVKVTVTDIHGLIAKGATLTLDFGGGPIKKQTGEDGEVNHEWTLSEGKAQDVLVKCCDFEKRVPLVEGLNEIRVPWIADRRFGEIATVPAEWEKVGVRLRGEIPWQSPVAADPAIGRRFLFLRPGVYDISNQDGVIAGTVEVIEGSRTSFAVRGFGAIQFNLLFTGTQEKLPEMFRVKILGIGQDTSHAYGTQILVIPEKGVWRHTVYGLKPGLYKVASNEANYDFSEVFNLADGEFRKVNAVLKSKADR